MDQENKSKTSPMMWMAGTAITLFCATGVAAMMGWIPTSMGQTEDASAVSKSAKQGGTASPSPSVPKNTASRPRTEPVHKTEPVQVAAAEKSVKCADCGVVESTRQVTSKGQGSGIGAVGGAVVGGLLGNQVGGGRGQDVATVVGVIGGGFAGNEIEKRVKSTSSQDVTVRMEDGSSRVVHEGGTSVRNAGDRVRIVDGAIRTN